MNYTVIKKLPSVEEIIQEFPLSFAAHKRIIQDKEEIKAILDGRDKRCLMIVGPCSAWPKDAVLEYAERLVKLNEIVGHALKLVMRVYIEKPRTIKGWTGPVTQPDVFAQPDIEAGVKYTRDMMIKVLEIGMPIANEVLFTHNIKSFLNLLSWVAIGARSAEDQEHRIFASLLDCAVGLKNPTHGSLDIAVNSIVAAQSPHVAVFDGNEVQTFGNPYAHLVLRGANHAPNYSIAHLEQVKQYMEKHQLKNPSVIIDASHDNCFFNGKKDYHLQPSIILEIIKKLKNRPDLKKLVKGFMLESFLQEGSQNINLKSQAAINLGGLSITDPCLGWDETAEFLMELAEVDFHDK